MLKRGMGNSCSLTVCPRGYDSPLGTVCCDNHVLWSTSRLGSVSPDGRGCPGSGILPWRHCLGPSSSLQGTPQPEIQHKRHRSPDPTPLHHGRSTELQTGAGLVLGFFGFQRDEEGNFSSLYELLWVIADSCHPVCCAIP